MKGLTRKLDPLHKKIIWLELLCISAWVFIMCIYISPGSFTYTLGNMIRNPMLIALNALPVVCMLILLFCLTQNSFISGFIVNTVFGLLNYANLLKIDGRDDPLVPGDFGLLREALQATGEYRLDMHYGILAIIILSSIAMLLLGVCLGKSEKRHLMRRIICIIVTAAAFVGAYFGLYSDRELYASFPVSVTYNVTAAFDELGFNYCFIYNLDMYTNEKPVGYSEAEVKEYIKEYDTELSQSEKPQVLMIMCEAFSDLFENDVFTYSDAEHPMKSYYEVVNSSNAVSGKIVVPNFGAGTANTEFDVLSGMQTNLISQVSNSALRSFHKDIPSIATAFAENGYDTFYMHPGESWFYNRNSALSHMGIDDMLFKEGFDDNTRLYDTAFLETLKVQLEQRTANGEKLFTYSTTIQNHQAYNYNKYPFDVPEVQTTAPLSDEAKEFLSVYGYGIKCSSDMLLELTEYLNSLSEPYVLVFFGDHLPNLGADYLSYGELGLNTGKTDTLDHTVDTFCVPFVIWCNDAYLNGQSAEDTFERLDLPNDGRISASFLGEITLELAGCEKADPFFMFLSELRREIPVIKTGIIASSDGVLTDEPDEQQQELMNKLHCWQYYRMVNQKNN